MESIDLQKNLETFYHQLKESLDQKYDLVYVGYDDHFTEEDLTALLREEYPWEYLDNLTEWTSESAYYGARGELENLVRAVADRESTDDEVLSEFEGSDFEYEILDMISERDSGSWYEDMLRNTTSPLMRVDADWIIHPDEKYYDPDLVEDSEELIETLEYYVKALGLSVEDNKKFMEDISVELYTPEYYSYYLVFRPNDLVSIVNAGWEDYVEVENPFLWATNPYQGNGWMERLTGSVRIKRSDLHMDSHASWYSADDVFGLHHPAMDCDVTVVKGESVTQ